MATLHQNGPNKRPRGFALQPCNHLNVYHLEIFPVKPGARITLSTFRPCKQHSCLHRQDRTRTTCPCFQDSQQQQKSSEYLHTSQHPSLLVESANPLEQLRVTTDPIRRTELLRELDTTWSKWEERYVPSPAEKALAEELGVGTSTVMLAAVQKPGLSSLDPTSQVIPTLRALRSAGLGAQDIWFASARCPHLLHNPTALSRWLDFLQVYGMQPRDIQNFLLRASPALLYDTTLYQAGAVVTFLKSLGLSDELLAARVLCVWPDLLAADVQGQLGEVVGFLLSLGLEVGAVGRVVVLWPEVLLRSVEGQLRPWVGYLRELGCSTAQVSEVICLTPHLLGFTPEEVFGGLLSALGELSLDRGQVAELLGASRAPLLAPSAASRVKEAAECLKGHGFSQEQVRQLALAHPEVLVAKPHDLSRSLRFVYEVVGGDNGTVLGCPLLLGRPLGQRLGPRYSFIQKRGLVAKYLGVDGSSFEFYKMLVAEDDEWCASLGLSVNEYQGFKLMWDEEYSERLHREAATEFQQELKKLGIYEGS